MESFFVLRAGVEYQIVPEKFWEWAARGELQVSDQVAFRAGVPYRPAEQIPELAAYLPSPPRTDWSGLGTVLLGGLALFGLFRAIDQLRPPRPARARRRSRNTEPLSDVQRVRAYVRDGGRCVYCRAELSFDEVHTDHRNPRVQGGSNRLQNLATSCAPCNLAKGPRTVRQFLG